MTDDHTAFGHDRFGRGAEKAAALERNTDELRKALEANTALTREIRDRLA